MRYSLGLDIGIASVGWAVHNLDRKRIEDLGARAFNAAENPKNQSPLAEPRRLARGARRRLRRKRGRIRAARDLFIQYGLIAEQSRDSAFAVTNGKPCPWQIRAEALDRPLSGEEFARALLHIVKHRGFKSNRKTAKDTEEGKMLAGIARNQKIMAERGYRTAGEMYFRHEDFQLRKRNSHESYLNTIDRATLESEIVTLFQAQRDLGSDFANPELENGVLAVFRWQKPFATGDAVLRLVGPCTFLGKTEGEIRAPKCSYHAERFRLLQDINKLSYGVNGDRQRLTPEQRAEIEAAAYTLEKLTYAQVRKRLDLPEEARFVGLEYMRRPEKGAPREFSTKCEDATAFQVKGYHTIRKACEKAGLWEGVKDNHDLIDDLAFALTFYKTDEDISDCLRERGAPDAVTDAALACDTFTGVIHISTKAAKRIIPFLEEGLVYSDACERAGFDHSRPQDCERQTKLPLITRELVNNPVVHRSLCQARRVVNAVIARYGSPYSIHIEFARDVGRSREDRRDIKQRHDDNAQERERLREQFSETFGLVPNGTDLLKWRLYREQCGQCAYSQQPIDANRLCESGYAEIDHILPYSRSFDDGRSNKVLALTGENQNKRNRTPHEAFGHDQARWDRFEAWARATIKDPRKRDNLLRVNYDAEVEGEWKERHLNDTRYAARAFAKFLRENLVFADPDNKLPVICLSGLITATARRLWGLEKHRDESDLHHALDASVIAALLPHQVQLITEWAKVGETGQPYVDTETGEIMEGARPRLLQPWVSFRKEIIARLSADPVQAIAQLGLPAYDAALPLRPVIVSRLVRRRTVGQIHEETIRSIKRLDSEGWSTVRKPLAALDKNSLNCLVCEEADPKLYAAILSRMEQFGFDAKKAFAEPLHKPTNDGGSGPVVRSVKVWQRQNTGIELRGGIADNGDMVRTDVFRKGGKYYLVPVYVSHMVSGKLPDRAITAHKPEDEWPVIHDSYEFLFALYPYNLIWMEVGDRPGSLCYYRGTHRANGALNVSLTNGEKTGHEDIISLGARNATLIEKYEIDVLGDYRLAPKEKRSGLEDNSDLETGEAEG